MGRGEGRSAEDGAVPVYIGRSGEVDALAVGPGRSGLEAEEMKGEIHRKERWKD